MATTTATITLQSADLTGDALALSRSANLTKAGFNNGLDQTTGVGRKTTQGTSENTLFLEAEFKPEGTDLAKRAHKIYLSNTSSTASEYFTLTLGTQTVGHLYAGDWCFLPWDGESDVKFTPSVATSMTIEFMLIYES
tara:strand:+ start:462 stop:875 length:414 start_codon:yes stop_codon:yes gene_type:complete